MPFMKIGPTVSLSATTTSSRIAIAGLDRHGGGTVRVVCPAGTGLDFAYIAFGDDSVVATSADIPVLPSSTNLLEAPRGTTHIAVITGAGSATVKATPGLGG